MKDAGRRLRSVREKFMLSQEEMAKKILISRQELSELENGKKALAGPLVVAIESLFMVDKDWLLTGRQKTLSSHDSNGGGGDENAVELLKDFKSLSNDGRRKLIHLAKVLKTVEKRGHAA